MTLKTTWNTAPEMLAALETCTDYGARFVRRTGEETFYPYADVIRRARLAAARFAEAGVAPGDRVAILLPTGIEFFDAYLGAMLAGAVPAALYPPVRLGRLDEYFEGTRRMLRRIEARVVVTDSQVGKLLGPAVANVDSVRHVIQVTELTRPGALPLAIPVADPDQPAFLQFSSGSTREPKAVVVTHRNLLCNLEMMAIAIRPVPGLDPAAGGVCWLPLYHDMGLVGCLFNGLHYPGTVTYIRPDDFVVRPSLWLRTISRTRAQVSPAPHFAYRLCASKIKDEEMEGVDLSCWQLALNGAEAVEAEGVRAFTERFARWGFRPEAMTPVYGLAEAGLAVSFGDVHSSPRFTSFNREALAGEGQATPGEGRTLPSVGRAMAGLAIEIRDETDRTLPDGAVGRIAVRGPSITPGYFNDSALTAQILRDGWLDTGDLGFFHDGELYIAGRAKDLIIVRGRNYSPQEIEELVWDMPGVREGCVAAVSHPVEGQGEQLIVLAERDRKTPVPDGELIAAIENRLVGSLPVAPYLVQLLEPGTLPRTSSGKLRRAEALRQYLNRELVPPDKVTSLKLFVELGKSQLAWGRFRLKNWS